MPVCLAREFRAALVPLLLCTASLTRAETVTYHLTGTVISVSDGSLGTLDLSPTFTNGAPITLDITVQRSTTPITSDNIVYFYLNPGTALSFTVGSYVCTGAFANVASVVNDLTGGPGPLMDEFVYQASGLVGPPVATATTSALALNLGDFDGTVFASGALPRPMPALTNFENKTFELTYADDVLQKTGIVDGTMTGVTTPARGTSWGRIKSDYR